MKMKQRKNALKPQKYFLVVLARYRQAQIDMNALAEDVKDLLPKLPDKSVLVVGGASFHKRNDIRYAIETTVEKLVMSYS